MTGTADSLRSIEWQRLLRPRRVVVIGATDTENTQARTQFTQLRDRLDAEVIPVHPTKPEVLGTPAYPSVLDVPGEIDVAVVLVKDALTVLEECSRRDVAFAVVFSAGFGELGTEEGHAAEARLADLASGSMRVIGPNTNLNLFEPWPTGRPGKRLAIITQSGYQGRPIVQGDALGIGIERWATLGNEADVEWADFVALFSATDGVGAIATFVEGFKDGRTMMLAADAAARAGMPIVCVKVGRSDEGAAMAQAHTGHLTGADAVLDAVFERFGVVRVDDLDETIEISGMFCHAADRVGDGTGGVAVYAMSGGTASHVVDLCGAAGVPVPRFDRATIDALGELLPSFLRRDNPVDSGGVITARPENRILLQLMLDDPATEILFAPITGVFPGMSDALARDLVALHQAGGKSVVTAWLSPIRDDAHRMLCDAGVPLFHSFTAAVRGMKELLAHRRRSRSFRSPFEHAPALVSKRGEIGSLLANAGPLDEVASKHVLAAYGIPTVPETLVDDADAAVRAATMFGFPVVLKLVAPEIAHKSDLGLVRVGVKGEDEVRRVHAELVAAATGRVLVQPMITDAVELLVGMTHQAPFGPTVTVGLGGVLTEVLGDVVHLVPPFDAEDARAALDSLRGAALLRGHRGKPACDIDAVVEALLAVQALAVDLGDVVSELDVNPLLVREKGKGALAVDALLVVS